MGWLLWMGLIIGIAVLQQKDSSGSTRWRRLWVQRANLERLIIVGVVGMLAINQIVEAVANERWTRDTTIFVGTACLFCGAAIWGRPWTRRS